MANLTKGITRRGNRAGRRIYAQSEKTCKVAVVLSMGHLEIARALGAGYPAKGIREALRRAAMEAANG